MKRMSGQERQLAAVPELAYVPAAERKRVWRKAYWQAMRVKRVWLALVAWFLLIVAVLPFLYYQFRVNGVISAIISGVVSSVGFFTIFVPVAMRETKRIVRMQIGTHCVRCGYDLTGNVSGVCSECGTARQPQAGREML